jgi:Leucine-rich repeat (LRR) protein
MAIYLMFSILILNSSFQFENKKILIIDSLEKYYDFIRNNEKDYFHIKIEGGLINQENGFKFHSDSIFDRIKENDSLKSLAIRSCHLTSIPDKICDIINLQSLDLTSNSIESSNEKLSKLKKLRFIGLDYNQLSDFEALAIQLLNFKDLHTISLNNNKLTNIPNNICSLKNLYILSLASNRISEIPACLSDFKSFSLNVQDNQIESIPCTYGDKIYLDYTIRIGGNPKINADIIPLCWKNAKGIEISR